MLFSTIETASKVSREHNRECSQSRILHRIATGEISAERRGNKWMISEDQIPVIAKLFSLRDNNSVAA